MGSALNILIVDDTVTYRAILKQILLDNPLISTLETANNGQEALQKIRNKPVDLVLLDVEMPVLGGIETLKILRRDFPRIGVVMVSALSRHNANLTIQALEMGALDFVTKPDAGSSTENFKKLQGSLLPILQSFSEKKAFSSRRTPPAASREIKAVAATSTLPTSHTPAVPRAAATTVTTSIPARLPSSFGMLAIGVSTGGPKALAEVIPLLPADLGVPVLLVIHMPPMFTTSLAEMLDKKSALKVVEAQAGDVVVKNTVYIAPGGQHMVVQSRSDQWIIGLNEDPQENGCRPAVDVLFRSIANTCDTGVLSVIMTGMGQDGLHGVKNLKSKGKCLSLSQSEDTCTVYGMPKAIDDNGLSDERVPLNQLAERIKKIILKR